MNCSTTSSVESAAAEEDFSSVQVDIAVHLFARIFDTQHFDIILEAMPAQARARVVHRIGWLNVFNPHRAELSFALDLREREDRLVAKMLVHMSVIEPGENVLDCSFAWDRCVDPVPGWALPQTWFNESGMPTKGSFKLRYYSGPKNKWAHRNLRTALMDIVLSPPLKHDSAAFDVIESHRTPAYISHSLTTGCMKESGVEITWSYD